MSSILMLVIGAGLLAVLYGAVQTASLLRASPGNAKMQEIAAAIQEGAQAYLNKQYTAIAVVGVVILIAVALLIGQLAAIGFATGAILYLTKPDTSQAPAVSVLPTFGPGIAGVGLARRFW